MAIDQSGNLFGTDSDGNIYGLDTLTGIATLTGNTGLVNNILDFSGIYCMLIGV